MMKRTKLTKRVVDDAIAIDNEMILWDAVIAGFAIKVQPSGRRTYFMKYRTKAGRQRKPNIGVHGAITCERAREIAQSWAAIIAGGKDPMDDRDASRSSPTVEEFLARVIEQDAKPRLKQRSVEEGQRLIRNVIVPKLGRLKVRDVTRAQIARFHHELDATKPQANRALAFLSKAFNLAERWGVRADGTNPCRNVPHYAERGRDRFLSESEIAALLSTLETPAFSSSPFVTFIKLALATGRRKSEILNVRWADVDLDRQIMRLADTKTGAQVCVLNDLAISTLRSAPRTQGQVYVIAGRNPRAPAVGIQKWWQRVRTAAGIGDVRIHDLRHTFASLGAAQGQSLHQIGGLLGHTSAQTTMRYAHHYEKAQRSASNAIGNMILAVTTPSKSIVHDA